jgi:transcriptional regulator with XRE-family HTH domain
MIGEVKAHPDAGRRVLLARLSAGISQRALAEQSGIDQSTVVRIERGEVSARPMTLGKLARVLDIPLEDLLEEG